MVRSRGAWLSAVLFCLSSFQASAQDALIPDSAVNTNHLRNNYTGFVGLQMTFPFGLQIFALGRAYWSGNSGTHTLKLVDAATGLDVPGSQVVITMNANGTHPFQYVTLPTPIILPSNKAYDLVSSETFGGDTWNDIQLYPQPSDGQFGQVIVGAIYTDAGGNYVLVPTNPPSNPPVYEGYAYVPPNMEWFPDFGLLMTSPKYNQVFTPPTVFNATVNTTSGYSFARSTTLQFYLDGVPYGPAQPATSATTYSSAPVDTSMIVVGAHTMFASSGGGESFSVPFSVASSPTGTFPLVYGETFGPVRNNFTGFVGMEFTTGNDALTVTSLGRMIATPPYSYSPGPHLLKLVNAATGVDVPGASATITLSGFGPSPSVGQFAYAYLATPITLTPNTSYYLLSQETSGGDSWYDYGPVLTNGITVNGPVYQAPGANYTLVPAPGYSYVPVSLGYRDLANVVPPSLTPLVTNFKPTFLRNNYSGYVGMEVTVGSAPLSVTSLGRYCVAGNSGAHTIKLVQASSGSDVAGSVTSLNMSGCTAGQYMYAPLASKVVLAAGASFYLVDEETAGADQWFDYSPVTVTAAAVVNGSVYTNSAGGFVVVPAAGTSYVPLNFLYSTGN